MTGLNCSVVAGGARVSQSANLRPFTILGVPSSGPNGGEEPVGGIECQQVGLLGDRGDQLDHIADARRRMREFCNSRIGALRLFDRLPRNLP